MTPDKITYGRWYVGKRTDTGKREAFTFPATPTESSHGKTYGYVIGPFVTYRAAHWLEQNPYSQCQTVAEIEQAARHA